MRTYQIREDDAIDDRHPVEHIEPVESETSEAAHAMMRLVFWFNKSTVPAHVGARVLVLSVALGIDDRTWADIARECDVTREAIRLMAKELENEFNLRSCNARTDSTRRACKRARQGYLEGLE